MTFIAVAPKSADGDFVKAGTQSWTDRAQSTWVMQSKAGYTLGTPAAVSIGSNNVVEFLLPSGHYDLASIEFYSAYVAGQQPDWIQSIVPSSSNPNDRIKVIVRSDLINQLVGTGKVNLATIQRADAWYIQYKAK